LRFLAVVLLAGACRYEFDALPPDATYCAPSPGLTQSQPATCTEPARFTVGASCLDSALTTVAVPNRLGMFTVDTTSGLTGWLYDLGGGVAIAQNVLVEAGVKPLIGAAVTVGGDIVLAGKHRDRGLVIYPMNAGLTDVRAPAVTLGGSMGTVPLAANGTSNEIAIAGIDGEIELRAIDSVGTVTRPIKRPFTPEQQPGHVTIATASTGYVVTWVAATPSPNEVRVALVDDTLTLVGSERTLNTTSFDGINPYTAWAPSSDRYLVVWFEKVESGGDDVWYQLLAGDLSPVGAAGILARDSAVHPRVATDGTDFWVVWRFGAKLEAAHIDATGVVMPQQVQGSDGAPSQWSLAGGAGEAILTWTEVGSTGEDLWIQRMCH